MKPKVSIIVPIYNVEKYLNQCVDSLLMQTLEDIEIILVDDGSPDKSGEIADSYAQKDKRIKVIHQENDGLGPARNSGMGIATGEYIGFVDSDDWVKPEMYERLYNEAVRTHADIVVSGHCDYTDGEVAKIKQHPLAGRTVIGCEEIQSIRKNLYGHAPGDEVVEAFPMSVCMSIYKRNLIEGKNIKFHNILSEDTIFNLEIYHYAERISFTEYTDYCYRKENQSSITLTFSPRKRLQYIDFLTKLAVMAAQEQDTECFTRTKRMAIDYCRLYTRMIGDSREPFYKKRRYLREFVQTKEIARKWEGYPVETLPTQQRVFHWMIMHGHYGCALLMNWIRRKMGR